MYWHVLIRQNSGFIITLSDMYIVHLDDIHPISLSCSLLFNNYLFPILLSSSYVYMCVHACMCMHIYVCICAGQSEGQRLHHEAFLSLSHSYFSSVSYWIWSSLLGLDRPSRDPLGSACLVPKHWCDGHMVPCLVFTQVLRFWTLDLIHQAVY